MKRYLNMAENWINRFKKEYPNLFNVVVFLIALAITNLISVFVTIWITHDSKKDTKAVSVQIVDYNKPKTGKDLSLDQVNFLKGAVDYCAKNKPNHEITIWGNGVIYNDTTINVIRDFLKKKNGNFDLNMFLKNMPEEYIKQVQFNATLFDSTPSNYYVKDRAFIDFGK